MDAKFCEFEIFKQKDHKIIDNLLYSTLRVKPCVESKSQKYEIEINRDTY